MGCTQQLISEANNSLDNKPSHCRCPCLHTQYLNSWYSLILLTYYILEQWSQAICGHKQQLTLTTEWTPDGERGLCFSLVLHIHMVLPEWVHHPSHNRQTQTTPGPKHPLALLPLPHADTHTPACNMAWHTSSCSSKPLVWLYRGAGQKCLITLCWSVARCSNYTLKLSE